MSKGTGKSTLPAERTDRSMSDRLMGMRDSEIRDMLRNSFNDPLHINPESIPEGWEYFYARDSFGGEIDVARMSQVQKRGWQPVTAEQRPDLVHEQFEGRESSMRGYIYYKGLILCQRPKRFGEIEREMEQQASLESMLTLPIHSDMNSEAVAKAGWQAKVYDNQTNIQQTRSFKD